MDAVELPYIFVLALPQPTPNRVAVRKTTFPHSIKPSLISPGLSGIRTQLFNALAIIVCYRVVIISMIVTSITVNIHSIY